ncbi:MAG: class I SAM-dependent methyltransferase [Planctomycetota bacterium]|jgi:2-polyprenyl-3-methyl-5-hydroxy-6-metoxy-1,4-benzoquinol methylase
MFNELEDINSRPKPFEFYTAAELWTDEHTSEQMLQFHLNESIDLSSRNHAFIDRSVEWIASQFNVTADTAIADFGCGPGLYTTRLAQTGADVTGIDFSPRSIDYAKAAAAEKNLDITYHCQNYLNFEADKRFDLIIMIFCDFCALSPDQRKTLLQKYHTFLKPGGSLLLDVHSLNIFNEKQESATCELNQLNGFWSPNTYYGFVNSFKYDKEKVSLDKYTIIEKDRTRTVYNWLQYFSRESLTHELAENGFNVQDCFSDVAGASFDPESPDMAIIATKP